jgi:hypothetical protein
MVDAPAAAQRLAGDEDVLRDRDVGEQRGFLEDDRDTGLARVGRPGQHERVPVGIHERPTVGLVNPAEDLDQRRLARPVLADQRVHLAAVEVERDVLQRVHRPKRLAGVPDAQDRPPAAGRCRGIVRRGRVRGSIWVRFAGAAVRPLAALVVRFSLLPDVSHEARSPDRWRGAESTAR